jgi:hypothetical protein
MKALQIICPPSLKSKKRSNFFTFFIEIIYTGYSPDFAVNNYTYGRTNVMKKNLSDYTVSDAHSIGFVLGINTLGPSLEVC